MPRLFINNREIECPDGATILEAAAEHGLRIPTLCHYPQTHSGGVCGVCAVEDLASGKILRACHEAAAEGMRLSTMSNAARQAREDAIRTLLLSGDHNCLVMDMPAGQWTAEQTRIMGKPWHQTLCPSYGNCRLQELAIEFGVSPAGGQFSADSTPLDDGHPMIVRDFSRCVQCGRCVEACNLVQVNEAIPVQDAETSQHRMGWHPLVNYENCTHCGECVQACPVGALFEKKAFGLSQGHDVDQVRTTCPYCGVGCQLWLHVKDGKIVKVTGVDGAQPNQGRLCVKGRFGYDFIYSPERLTSPLIKDGDGFREASWDEALDLVANKLLNIISESGPDAIAGVSCARSTNEDSFNMQKLFRAVIGTNNIDHCART